MKIWEFVDGKYTPQETWRRPGKCEHADCVAIVLTRSHGFRFLHELATQLANEENAEILLSFFGGLTRDPDGEESQDA